MAKKKSFGFKSQLVMIFSLMAAVVLLPSTVMLLVGMMPTLAAMLADRTRKKIRVITVGAMNLAGCSPFLLELWVQGHSIDKAISLITDPWVIIVMYSGAAVGYMIDWCMTSVVSSYLYQRGVARHKAIRERQKELIDRWGREVSGQIPLDKFGFALSPEARAAAAAARAKPRPQEPRS